MGIQLLHVASSFWREGSSLTGRRLHQGLVALHVLVLQGPRPPDLVGMIQARPPVAYSMTRSNGVRPAHLCLVAFHLNLPLRQRRDIVEGDAAIDPSPGHTLSAYRVGEIPEELLRSACDLSKA